MRVTMRVGGRTYLSGSVGQWGMLAPFIIMWGLTKLMFVGGLLLAWWTLKAAWWLCVAAAAGIVFLALLIKARARDHRPAAGGG